MASQREEIQVIEEDGSRRKVVENRPSTQHVLVARISRLIWLIVAVIITLIVFRFTLYLLAANPANGFANFIYMVTNVLVAPFIGLVAAPALGSGGSFLDLASLFAIVVYLLLGWGIVRLFRIIFADPGGSRRVTTVQHRR